MHKSLAFLSGMGVAYIGYLSLSDGLVLRVGAFRSRHRLE